MTYTPLDLNTALNLNSEILTSDDNLIQLEDTIHRWDNTRCQDWRHIGYMLDMAWKIHEILSSMNMVVDSHTN